MEIGKEFCEAAAKDEDGLDVAAGTLVENTLSIAHSDLIVASISAANIHEELVSAYWLEAACGNEVFFEGRMKAAQDNFEKLASTLGYDLVKRAPDGEKSS